ncbi:28S ribosomal protein S5, mitochondrial, partial [Antrostomus carolinensis]|uniref:28S ribosomal protein S5, mitochondrial n=1 Tax=Antrostomus carolinensis TaxID=279965 RepID=UPI0010A97FF8
MGKAGDRMNALRKAKNKAIRCLQFIELYQNHTIYHDIAVKFKSTNIRMKKQNKGFASVPVKGSCCSYSSLVWAFQTQCSISTPWNVTVNQCRRSSFFNTLTADELWKGALAETGVGVKKGRGKRRKKKLRKNLNRGQEIGEGRSGFLWPGLNAPLIKSGKVQEVTQRKKEELERIQSEIVQQRDTWEKKRKVKIKREGGWSGKCWGGVLLDPPDPGPNG